MPVKKLLKIFQMLYRGNKKTISVLTLNAVFFVESVQHIGTSFTILLPFDIEK